MIYFSIAANGAITSSNAIAKVSEDGIVEAFQFNYDSQNPSMLKQCVYEDDWGEKHYSIIRSDNTAVIRCFNSRTIQVGYQEMNPLTGDILFKSMLFTLSIDGKTGCMCCDNNMPNPAPSSVERTLNSLQNAVTIVSNDIAREQLARSLAVSEVEAKVNDRIAELQDAYDAKFAELEDKIKALEDKLKSSDTV